LANARPVFVGAAAEQDCVLTLDHLGNVVEYRPIDVENPVAGLLGNTIERPHVK
jgi:hypothetical protein